MDDSTQGNGWKKTRRHNRGSKKGTKLQNEIQSVDKEIQKLERQIEESLNIDGALTKQRRRTSRTFQDQIYNDDVNSCFMKSVAFIKQRTGKNISIKIEVQKENKGMKKSKNKYSKTEKINPQSKKYNNILKKQTLVNISDKNGKKRKHEREKSLTIDENVRDRKFPKTIKRKDMKEILEKQSDEERKYITGTFRINNKFPRFAFISATERSTDEGIAIEGFIDRNRAMEKDIVVVEIKPEAKWQKKDDGEMKKTGKVVCVLGKVHTRKAIGTLEIYEEKIKFRPRDSKFPILTIDPEDLPTDYKNFKENSKEFSNTLFIAKMKNWSSPYFCSGKILKAVGNIGDLDAETEAILLENGLDVTPYEENLLQDLPDINYKLTEKDLDGREDWRDQCIFTIDPATAVDLDDAVSCKKLENGNFEVGVHIADVTNFLKASCPLDEKVSNRATTVYLVNTVYHMLPKSLCQVCSLLPGQDKLGFSVIWEITPEAQIINHRFAKTVINSCCQMSYQQAQKMIEDPNSNWNDIDIGLKVENGYEISQLCQTVNELFKISSQLRAKRFANGALTINQPKLQIILDRVTELPVNYCLEERQESNKLIEEFMLLANMTVAEHIHREIPETALLRHHNPPKKQHLDKTLTSLRSFGIHLNTDSAKELQESMAKFEPIIEKGIPLTEEQFVENCRMMVINSLCAQAMMRANYICAGALKQDNSLRHYALNVPLYTHFTSPIRRYSDCIVHRLLMSTLTGKPMPDDWTTKICASLAMNCNRKKDSAKKAQEKSTELYFTQLLAQNGPISALGIVMSVKQHCMDIILCHIGITLKIEYFDIQKKATVEYSNEDSIETVTVHWKNTNNIQVINIFTILSVDIRKHPKLYSIQTTLSPPKVDITE